MLKLLRDLISLSGEPTHSERSPQKTSHSQVLPVELKEPSHLPLFVYMTQPVAMVSKLV